MIVCPVQRTETQPCFCNIHTAATILDPLRRTTAFSLALTQLVQKSAVGVRELLISLMISFTFKDISTDVIFSSDSEQQRPKQSMQ